MLPKDCGKLLYNAVRETLEIMAFADVVPCSIKVAGEEFARDEDFVVSYCATTGEAGGWGEESDGKAPADAWGTVTPDVSPAGESWGDSPEPTSSAQAEDDWGAHAGANELGDDTQWGTVSPPTIMVSDPWGNSSLADACTEGLHRLKEADFDEMVAGQTEWTWACMRVNSPDVHSVWFIVPQGLAHSLMQNMYAGESMQLDTLLIKDLIAELTNVLGGRLMLLLEELGGEFTLTVPDIGFGMPDLTESSILQGVVCKVVVDSEHPIIVVLCFNQGGVLSKD